MWKINQKVHNSDSLINIPESIFDDEKTVLLNLYWSALVLSSTFQCPVYMKSGKHIYLEKTRRNLEIELWIEEV